jgi:hypothetical protein
MAHDAPTPPFTFSIPFIYRSNRANELAVSRCDHNNSPRHLILRSLEEKSVKKKILMAALLASAIAALRWISTVAVAPREIRGQANSGGLSN